MSRRKGGAFLVGAAVRARTERIGSLALPATGRGTERIGFLARAATGRGTEMIGLLALASSGRVTSYLGSVALASTGRGGKRSEISRPTMCLMMAGMVVSRVGSVTMLAPSRRTVMRSARAKTSSSLWEM